MKSNFDVNETPLITIWETTQACDVACLDYGDRIHQEPDPLELSTQEAEQLIDEAAGMRPPIFVMTGADPLKRGDIYHLVRYARLRAPPPFPGAYGQSSADPRCYCQPEARRIVPVGAESGWIER